MTSGPVEIRRHVSDLWKQAVEQLDEVRGVIVRSAERLEMDLQVQRVRSERDKLLRRLGEQTYRLTSEGRLPVPGFVRRTVDRLHEVIEEIVVHEEKAEAVAHREVTPQRAKPGAGDGSAQVRRKAAPTKKVSAQKSSAQKKVAKKAPARKKTAAPSSKKTTKKKTTTRRAPSKQ